MADNVVLSDASYDVSKANPGTSGNIFANIFDKDGLLIGLGTQYLDYKTASKQAGSEVALTTAQTEAATANSLVQQQIAAKNEAARSKTLVYGGVAIAGLVFAGLIAVAILNRGAK